jgi:DNA mismatch endonuclease (patch repair protein)
MADVHTPRPRSFNMSRIKGKDTKSEMLVRKFFACKRVSLSSSRKTLPGKPDIAEKMLYIILQKLTN